MDIQKKKKERDMRSICNKKKKNGMIMIVLSLMVLFFMPQNIQAATVKRPSQVTKFTAELTASNTAKLTWKKAGNAAKYQVYCSVDGGIYKKIKTTKSTHFTHTKLKNGAVYVYKVRGINKKKTGNYSSVQRIRTLAASKAGLTVSISGAAAEMRWNKVTNATGYYVYKASNGKWNKIATTKERSYAVKNLELGSSYTYKVVPYLSVNSQVFKGSASTKTIKMPTSGWLLDYVQPYSTIFSYKSYNAHSFKMRGTAYTHGFTTRGSLRDDGGIYFNLGGKYSSISFKVGMCDGNYTYRRPAQVVIKADGKTVNKGDFWVRDDEAVSTHTINVKGCKDLRIFITQGNILKKIDTEYGFADIKLNK